MTTSRRLFLQRTLLGAAGLGAGGLLGCGGSDSATSPFSPSTAASPGDGPFGRLLPGAIADRVLVVIELEGGNDGLSTLIPAASARYQDLRGDLARSPDDVLAVDDEMGLHPNLARMHRRGLLAVEGVGAPEPDLSHFAMTRRWQWGDLDGSHGRGYGFLGRVVDALGSEPGALLPAVSVAGPAPQLAGATSFGLHLGGTDDLWFLEQTDWAEAMAFRRHLSSFDSPALDLLIELADRLAAVAPDDEAEPSDADRQLTEEGGELGWQLQAAADLIEADLGTRVVRARMGGFDTHEGHRWRHDELMARFDAAVDGFQRRLGDAGLEDRVLVATVSEFGRRVEPNQSGLDHGAASTMLVTGPGAAPRSSVARIGEASPLNDLDDEGNLRSTVSFDRYLGALAEQWLGVEATSVLPSLVASGADLVDLGLG